MRRNPGRLFLSTSVVLRIPTRLRVAGFSHRPSAAAGPTRIAEVWKALDTTQPLLVAASANRSELRRWPRKETRKISFESSSESQSIFNHPIFRFCGSRPSDGLRKIRSHTHPVLSLRDTGVTRISLILAPPQQHFFLKAGSAAVSSAHGSSRPALERPTLPLHPRDTRLPPSRAILDFLARLIEISTYGTALDYTSHGCHQDEDLDSPSQQRNHGHLFAMQLLFAAGILY